MKFETTILLISAIIAGLIFYLTRPEKTFKIELETVCVFGEMHAVLPGGRMLKMLDQYEHPVKCKGKTEI